MRKALCVGIDNYEHVPNLSGCVNDANAVGTVLERNADGTMNFGVKKMCATSKDSRISRSQLKAAVEELFKSETEVSLFYFAGHGSFDSVGGYLCTSEVRDVGDGFPLNDVMNLAAASKAQNKIIILDSCCSGSIASYAATPDRSVIYDGTVVLAACEAHDVASEEHLLSLSFDEIIAKLIKEKPFSIGTGGLVSVVSAFNNHESGRYTTEQAWIAALVGIATTVLTTLIPISPKIAIGVDLTSYISNLIMDSIFNYNNGHLWGYDDKKS